MRTRHRRTPGRWLVAREKLWKTRRTSRSLTFARTPRMIENLDCFCYYSTSLGGTTRSHSLRLEQPRTQTRSQEVENQAEQQQLQTRGDFGSERMPLRGMLIAGGAAGISAAHTDGRI